MVPELHLDEATGAVTLLTDGKSRNSHGVWSRDGQRMAYTATRRTRQDADIYVIDPAADPSTDRLVLEVEGGGWGVADWSPDGRSLLLVKYISIAETEVPSGGLWSASIRRGRQYSASSRTHPYRRTRQSAGIIDRYG